MNINGLSTNGLTLLHRTIAAALAEDDALPKNAKKYEVREATQSAIKALSPRRH